MTYTEIQYKYEMGVLSVDDMCDLVASRVLTKEEFFEITRLNYDGINKKRGA